MMRIGANCPNSVPSLLRGCIEAYSLAILHGNLSIANVAKQAVTALAQLSPRESSRILSLLQTSGVMVDVQLKLAMAQDAMAAACVLIQHLSSALIKSRAETTSSNVGGGFATSERQASGDASSDFRGSGLGRDYTPLASQGKEPTLLKLLQGNSMLRKKAYEFCKIELSSSKPDAAKGKLCLLLKAYGWLLLVQQSGQAEKFVLSSFLLDHMITVLRSVSEALKQIVPSTGHLPGKSTMDDAYNLVQCTCILTIARILQEIDADELVQTSIDLLHYVLAVPGVSIRSHGLVSKIRCLIQGCSVTGLYQECLQALTGKALQEQEQISLSSTALDLGLKRMCEQATKDKLELTERVEILEVQLSTLLLQMRMKEGRSDNESFLSKITEMLRRIFTDDEIMTDSLIYGDDAATFVIDGASFLSKSKRLLPVVFPTQIEALCSALEFGHREGDILLTRAEGRFLLQLLYCFEFLEQEPKSPFAVDPRALAIKEALIVCKNLSSRGKSKLLSSRLQDQAIKQVPEVLFQMQQVELEKAASTSALRISLASKQTKEVLISLIRDCVASSNPDPLASKLEGFFLFAQSHLPVSDLCTAVVSSLLAPPSEPLPFLTYSLLCRDPLVLFKCSMKIWKCRVLRRMSLTILCSLLESNTLIISNTSVSDDVAAELIAARNALVVRCLLVATSGAESGMDPFYCSLTTSVLRTIISGHRGLVALLVKQGLPNAALDWLVEYIPETISDSQELIHIISERSSLTPADRLVAADAVLRIAIAHGHRNEADAEAMVYTSLSQLVNCFFLVVGPVGVPVNALFGDGSGLDVTQTSRQAAFRMLKILLKVRGRRTRLRNECGIALQKLASLCKSESAISGVAGAVAGRRKALLKEIFDAITKAVNSMGIVVGTQSAAA